MNREFRGGPAVGMRRPERNAKRSRRLRLETLEERRLLTVEVEPNETPASATLALSSNDVLEGHVTSMGDCDYFRVVLSQGQRLMIDTWNANAETFSPTLPPAVEILDAAAHVVAVSLDGRSPNYVVPADGNYFVRVSSQHAFGSFADEYAMRTTISAYGGGTESEPNDTAATADPLVSGQHFRGSLASTADADFFSLSVTAGQTLFLKFAATAAQNPSVRLHRPDGSVLLTDLSGDGFWQLLSTAGTYTVELRADNAAGSVTGQYVGSLGVVACQAEDPEAGEDFDAAVTWNLASTDSYMAGRLTSLADVDVFACDVTGLTFQQFGLGQLSSDYVSKQSRWLTLYNQYGQPLYAAADISTTYITQPLAPGRYYVTVQATSPAGLGSYVLRGRLDEGTFGKQRDVPLYFLDFDGQESHLGYAWVNDYGVPQAIPLLNGLFESRYDIYDVDVTLVNPPSTSEHVAQGIGDFGDIGAGGWGGGNYGKRRPSGDSVVSATTTSWTSLSYGASGTMIHEDGHGSGLPHARNVLDVMAYDHQANLFALGSYYSFLGTDSRRPGTTTMNPRDYLDWALQAGSQVAESSGNDTPASAQSLDRYLVEMSADFTPTGAATAAGNNPHDTETADFNGDGHPDLLLANYTSKQVSVLLGSGDGTCQPAVNFSVSSEYFLGDPLAVGDFNGDQRMDFAVANYADGDVSVYVGQGDGTFQSPTDYASGPSPTALAAADMNGDGKLDLVAANGTGRVSVLAGLGNGGFQSPATYSARGLPMSLVVADLNGDGRRDVATINRTTNDLSVLLGNGDGTLQAESHYAASGSGCSLVSGDFNGDGRTDMAYLSGSSVAIGVLLGNGNGTFQPQVLSPVSSANGKLAVGDVNADGRLDLVSPWSSGTAVLFGAGDGTFGRPVPVSTNVIVMSAAVVDMDGDLRTDLAVACSGTSGARVLLATPDPRNDRVVLYGAIDSASDADFVSFQAAAGETWAFDVDSAEFQNALDGELTLGDAQGTPLATSDDARDRESGLLSQDPYLVYTFPTAGTYTLGLRGGEGTAGGYRLKLTPQRAFDASGPRILAALPDGSSQHDSTRQLLFFLNDQLDPATLTPQAIEVRGQATGVRAGTAEFSPLDSTLVWRADAPLPADVYTVTIAGGAAGVADLRGNRLDGETDGTFHFPEISGDGQAGGDFVLSFQVTGPDNTPATASSASFRRHPYNRGQFSVYFTDELDLPTAAAAQWIARGTGPDGAFDTADDRLLPLDPMQDKINSRSTLNLYSRGIPDPDRYRIEGTVLDAVGNTVSVSREVVVTVTVPESALFADDGLTQGGLTGSYVNRSLRSHAAQDDWRVTQTIAGTRQDRQIVFQQGDFGSRAEVGVTGGTDDDWDNFSVQWDGWLSVSSAGARLRTQSSDGCRLWLDLNGDGVFAGSGDEFLDNHWGSAGSGTSALSAPLAAGVYRIRVQYENASSWGNLSLEWITPDQPGLFAGLGHGPSVIDVSVQPNAVCVSEPLATVSVDFGGAVDPSTLRPENFRVRYSPDPTFFDANDVLVAAQGNAIGWDPVHHRATFTASQPLGSGQYLVELNGDAGGITDPAGRLLDGEYLDTYVPGSPASYPWADSPSGDGVPGGDYRAAFTVATPQLTVQLQQTAIGEFDGATTATVTRNTTDLSQPLTVTLLSSDPSEASVPLQVVIPAQQASATFAVQAVDDLLLDGTQAATITAQATWHLSGSASLSVTDHETLTLAIAADLLSEHLGTTTATVTRSNTDVGLPLTVTLFNGDPTELALPAQVVILADQSSATFTIQAVDDLVLDPLQTATVLASAAGYVDGSDSVDVRDALGLTVDLLDHSMSEFGGSTTVTITRGDADVSQPLLVALTSDDPGEATVPAQALFLANQTSVTVVVQGVDDQLLDGTQTVHITAAAEGHVADADLLEVTDHETLVFSVAAAAISEHGGWTTGTVTRSNLDTAAPLSVALVSGDPGEATLPAEVVIPAQQSSATFTIQAVDDQVGDGSQMVSFAASAAGYVGGIASLRVVEPYLVIRRSGISTDVAEGGAGDTYSVALGGAPAADVTVQLIGGSQLMAVDGAQPANDWLSFTAGNWSTPQTVRVTAVNDSLREGPHAGVVQHAALSSDANYDGLAGEPLTANILDNDESLPLANRDAYAVSAETVLAVAEASGVLANDTDADGDGLTARLVDLPIHGVVALAAGGSFTYTPDAGFHGEDRFTYRAHDGVRDSASAVPVTIRVEAPRLVRDISQAPASSNPQYPVEWNGIVYFAATDFEHGTELWRSDGTPAGTWMVKDLSAGQGSSSPSSVVPLNGVLYFTCSGLSGLWKSDGTAAGTQLVTSSASWPSNLRRVGDHLYLQAWSSSGYELWKSDGTAAGTALLKDIYPGSTSSNPRNLVGVNGTLFFTATDAANGEELWRSDGTEAGTRLVKDIRAGANSSNPAYLTNVGGTVYMRAYDDLSGNELWKSDGTAAGTSLVKDIYTGGNSYPAYLAELNGLLYFQATTGSYGYELWKSDGSSAGTTQVKDIRPGSSSSSPAYLANLGGTLYFQANDGVAGMELWQSDGTAAGTSLAADLAPGSGSSSPMSMIAVDGTILFVADDGSHGRELWRRGEDGVGTALVADLFTADVGAAPAEVLGFGSSLLFTATEPATGTELWISNGTAAGTALVKDVQPGTGSSSIASLTRIGAVAYFSGYDSTNGTELWRTNGTAAGTSLVKNIRASGSSNPQLLTNANGTLFFRADDGTNGAELWRSDGTAAGTYLVKNIAAGSTSSAISSMVSLNGTLFFVADDGLHGAELWKSDGTDAGTVLVKEIVSGTGSPAITLLTAGDGRVFFSANDGVHGVELWTSDGTDAGTTLVKDVYSGSSSSSPGALTAVGSVLYFSANDGSHGTELWRSDGTDAGTWLVKDIYAVNVYSSSPSLLTHVNGTLYFQATNGTLGVELWKSDGTDAGTVLVKDLLPGTGSSSPAKLTGAGGLLFFTVSLSPYGTELWRSDGTAAGTVLVGDIAPGTLGSTPDKLVAVGSDLYFTADDGAAGRELWIRPHQPPTVDLNGPAAGIESAAAFAEAGAPVPLTAPDAMIRDGDSPTIAAMTVRLENRPDGDAESLTADVTGTLITASYSPASGTLSLTGTDTAAHYQQVLRSIRYANSAPDPTFSLRTITVLANDGISSSATATATVTIVPVNDPPEGSDTSVASPEDTTYVFAVLDFGFSDPHDTPSDALRSVAICTLPAAGELQLDGVPVLAGDSASAADIAAGRLRFLPAPNGQGNPYATFTFQVQDDGGTANGGNDQDPMPNTVSLVILPAPDVTGRYLFYNNSAWDGNNPAADDQDFDAIALPPPIAGHGHPAAIDEPAKELGKQALLPDQTAGFVNYSSYSRGINGIILAFDDLSSGTAITAADFAFRTGNDGNPAAWAVAPAPTAVRVARDVNHPNFAGRPDLVTITWADDDPYTTTRETGAISNQWLQVTVLAGAGTGLAVDDVFYFGNQIAESGNSATDASVDQNDEIGARNHPHSAFNAAAISDPYDFNRDGKVDQNDEILARNNPASAFTRLQLIVVPSAEPGVDSAVESPAPARVAEAPRKAAGRRDLVVAALDAMDYPSRKPDPDPTADDLMAGCLAPRTRRRWAELLAAHDVVFAE